MTEFKYIDVGVAADTLFRWLGTFWTHVVTNSSRAAAKDMQKGATLAAAQTQLNMLESLKVNDRTNVPVFHRDRWTPAVIHKEERNTGGATIIKLETGGGEEGYQLITDNPLKLGMPNPTTGYVYYPLDLSTLRKLPDCMCDNLFNPTKVLVRDRDFVLRDNTIILRESDDPFTKTTYNINTDMGTGLEECVLWLFNAEVDKNYVYDSIGHVVNIYTESDEVCKRIINMVWDCYTNEANIGIISSLLGALYNIPTCLTETELVELVKTDTGLVVTDRNIYYADPAKLSVKAGDTVKYGDAFDTRLRLYGYPFASSGLDGVTMDNALPAIVLPASMFKTTLKLGPAGLNRVPTEIVDANNGTPPVRPRFKLFQDSLEDDRFWANLWSECEAVSSTTALSCFSDYITYNTGTVLPGTIKPLEWYLGFMAGPNTLIARIDAVKPATAPAISISKLLPAHARLIVLETSEVIESTTAAGEDTGMVLADVGTITSVGDELVMTDKVVALKWRS
jgi:hypothetical protein